MNLYKKYYLVKKEIQDIIDNGIIVFDTSVLLELYYYSDETQIQLFQDILSGLNNRLWIPAQCYFEFLKNKGNVVGKPRKSYEALLDKSVPKIVSQANYIGKKELSGIKGLLNTLKETTKKGNKHPYLNQDIFISYDQALDELENHISRFLDVSAKFEQTIGEEINKKIDELKIKTDDIQQFIEASFDIGPELSFQEMLEICTEGEQRYKEKIPPGYEDAKKTGMQKYGDLFAWKEILHMAKERNVDVFLVTNDVKEDWADKEKKAPRFELLKEFNSYTTKRFWSCTMREFLYYLNEREGISEKIPEKIIMEADYTARQVMEDVLKGEIEFFYWDALKDWIDGDSEYTLMNKRETHPSWNVFGNCYLYDAVGYDGKHALILMNIVEQSDYATIYQALNNLWEIKRVFESIEIFYDYRQVIVARTVEGIRAISDQIHQNKKLSLIYYNEEVENDLMYISDGKLIYYDSNHAMG